MKIRSDVIEYYQMMTKLFALQFFINMIFYINYSDDVCIIEALEDPTGTIQDQILDPNSEWKDVVQYPTLTSVPIFIAILYFIGIMFIICFNYALQGFVEQISMKYTYYEFMTNRKCNVVMTWPWIINLIHYLICVLMLIQWYLIIQDPSNCSQAIHKTLEEYFVGKMYEESYVYHGISTIIYLILNVFFPKIYKKMIYIPAYMYDVENPEQSNLMKLLCREYGM